MIEIIKAVFESQFFKLKRQYLGKFRMECQPTINISSIYSINLVDFSGQKIKQFPEFPSDFFYFENRYFKENASKRITNCVEFIIENDSIVEIKEYWDEKIIEDFNANLPKSKRGKIKAWYDNEELWQEYLQKQAQKDNIS